MSQLMKEAKDGKSLQDNPSMCSILKGIFNFKFFFLEGDSTPIVFMYIVYTCIYEVTASMVSNNFIH